MFTTESSQLRCVKQYETTSQQSAKHSTTTRATIYMGRRQSSRAEEAKGRARRPEAKKGGRKEKTMKTERQTQATTQHKVLKEVTETVKHKEEERLKKENQKQ